MPPTILPYVPAVKRAPVAKTPAADGGLGEWIDGPKRPLYRRVHLTSRATLRPRFGERSGETDWQ